MFKLNYYYKLKNEVSWIFNEASKLKNNYHKCIKTDKYIALLENSSLTLVDWEYKLFIEKRINPDIKKKLRKILNV